eukprot:m.227736 g.227736  ORF g.227736 m.227736 type:complete len:887 (-) comp33530_c0_seq1:113-2773(-)
MADIDRDIDRGSFQWMFRMLVITCWLCDRSTSAVSIEVWPPTTLLPAKLDTVEIQVNTSAPVTACTWELSGRSERGILTPTAGSGSRSFTATVSSLLTAPDAANILKVTCCYTAQGTSTPQFCPFNTVVYRCVPDVEGAPYPKKGNLWGSYNYFRQPLSYAASRVSLWLGSDWNITQIAELRKHNPHTIVLTSINACEHEDGLPEHFYLHNISSPTDRLESWPGAFRLDITLPEVQRYQATIMYSLVVLGGSEGHATNNGSVVGATSITYDGIFVDNVFIDDGWNTNRNDIHNNKFFPCTLGCGCDASKPNPTPDTEACFNANWHTGIQAELDSFRYMMPHALMDGHAMGNDGPDSPIIGELFNAISIGFTVPMMVEGLTSFKDGYDDYSKWNDATNVRSPHITMVESAVRLMYGYGYGFDTQLAKHGQEGYIPDATLLFAQQEYQYMRFGLAFTLMQDGYFTHEIGDSSHGQDWWYDEEDFVLGKPITNATQLPPSGVPPPPPLQLTDYILWANTQAGASATLTMDPSTLPPHVTTPSAKVVVDKVCTGSGCDDSVELEHQKTDYVKGQKYKINFWAKSSASTTIHVVSQQEVAPWSSFGLDEQTYTLSAEWVLFSAEFTATATASTTSPLGTAKISFLLGHQANTTVWIGGLELSLDNSISVFRRDFDCGIAVVNGEATSQTIDVGAGYARLNGSQAPKWQYTVDDANTTAFSVIGGHWNTTNEFEHGYSVKSPTAEQNVPPYYHQYMGSLHMGKPGSTADFDIGVREQGTYNVSVWWPRATPAMGGWNTKMGVAVISDGKTVCQTSVDLTSLGDRWVLVAQSVHLSVDTHVQLVCPTSGGGCVADAVLVESEARFNDGAEVQSVTLAGKDGIVLRRFPPATGC